MNNRLIGFIGCGEIAHMHAACLVANGAIITGGYDISAQAAEYLVRQHGGSVFAEAEQLCQQENIDAIYICTRHDSHVRFIEMAARYGKAVFCEKPLALSLAEANKAAEIVEHYQIPLVLGFNHRYSPGIQKLKKYLDDQGGIADVINIQFVTAPFLNSWAGLAEEGGGVLVCLGSHVFDLVHYLASADIKEIKAISLRQRLQEPYMDDAFSAIMTNKAGQLITVNAHDHGNLRFSTDPTHRINKVHAFIGEQTVVASTSQFELFDKNQAMREQFSTDVLYAWGYQELNKRFLQKLNGVEIEVPDVQSGINAARMVEMCRNNM